MKSLDTYFEIINNNEVTLDDHEWKEIYFALHVADSNGVEDIAHIKWEIKAILDGCTEDINNDGVIDPAEEDTEN